MDIALELILRNFGSFTLNDLVDSIDIETKEFYCTPINFEFKLVKLSEVEKYESLEEFISDLYNSDDTLLFFILLTLNCAYNFDFGFEESYNETEEMMEEHPEDYDCEFEDLPYGFMGEVSKYTLETKNLMFTYSYSSGLERFTPEDVQSKN